MAYIRKRYAQQWQSKDTYLDKDVEIKMVPAPVGGIDALSPLAAMEPKYAADMTNWVPRTGWIELRGGYNAWAQGITQSPINSLMIYRPPTGLQVMFAASGGEIWDASLYGMPTLSRSGLLGDKWQSINFTPALGANYLLAVNGLDSNLLSWNGTTWVVQTITGTTDIFFNIASFKRRVWLVPNNSTKVYFLGTDSIAGAATALDLGSFMTQGGSVLAMGTWTLDGGQGPDDTAIFVTTEGQVIQYKGTDPTNANAWALVGTFDLADPIGRRCLFRYGSDLLIITVQGILPISQALAFDPAASRSVAVTNRIQNKFMEDAQNYSGNFGWEILSFPQQSLLFVNVPQVENNTQIQRVQNALTGAWTKFNGWNANCFALFNDSLYFGDNTGNVNLAYASSLDLVTPILADVKCAFNYFEQPGRLKTATMIRPFLVADGTLIPTIQIDVDFADSSPAAPVTILQPSGALWDVSLWDASTWSTGITTVLNWLSCTALGTALAVRMTVNLAGGGSASEVAQGSVFDTAVFDTSVFDGNGAIIKSGAGLATLQVNVFEIALQFGGPV
jgi:hypothetical protein